MFSKIFSAIKLVFSCTSEISTAAERSLDRYRRAARTSLIAMLARIVNIATGLITVPIVLSYFGPDRYGLWVALSSFVAFLSFTDMGFGIGLQNALSKCYGQDDRVTPRSYVSGAMLVMIMVFMVFTGVALFVLPLIPLDKLIKVSTDSARAELLPTAQTILIIFGFGLPAGLIQRICNAHQRGYWGNLWLAVGRVVGFVGILVCIYLGLGLPSLAACIMGAPFLCLAIASVFMFKKQLWLRPSISAVTLDAVHKIFGTGITAVGAQIAFAIVRNGPAIIIANRLGVAAVIPFAVTQKLLGVIVMLLQTLVSPLWPAYGEAAVRGDWVWVKKTFRRTVFLAVAIFVPTFFVMSFSGRWFIELWTRDALAVPSWSLLMACNIWCSIMAWNVISSTLLNGLNHMIGQATYGIVIAVIALGFGYWLAQDYGVTGVIWSAVFIGGLLRGVAMGLEAKYVMRGK